MVRANVFLIGDSSNKVKGDNHKINTLCLIKAKPFTVQRNENTIITKLKERSEQDVYPPHCISGKYPHISECDITTLK